MSKVVGQILGEAPNDGLRLAKKPVDSVSELDMSTPKPTPVKKKKRVRESVQIIGEAQQWWHDVKLDVAEGTAEFLSDQSDDPIQVTFDWYSEPYDAGDWDNPPSGGNAEVTSVTGPDGQPINLTSEQTEQLEAAIYKQAMQDAKDWLPDGV